MKLPSISIVTVCYNPDTKIWKKSLNAIRKQNYLGRVEHIVMDGGSINGSDDIARNFGCSVIVRSDLQNFALKRMMIGIRKAKGSLILILEPDNIIVGRNWLMKMVQPFIEDRSIVGTFSIFNTYEKNMPLLTKYYSLFGVNDTLLHYLHKSEKLPLYKLKYDKGRIINKNKNFTTVIFDKDSLPTLGDNGHMVRRNAIKKVIQKSETFLHTDAFYDLLRLGYNRYGVVNNSIIHFTGSSMLSSFRKRIQYKDTFNKYKRTYLVFDSSSKKDIMNVILFGIYTVTIIQPLYESIRGYMSKREPAWFLHPVMCFGTFFSYLFSVTANFMINSAKRYAI